MAETARNMPMPACYVLHATCLSTAFYLHACYTTFQVGCTSGGNFDKYAWILCDNHDFLITGASYPLDAAYRFYRSRAEDLSIKRRGKSESKNKTKRRHERLVRVSKIEDMQPLL